MEAEGDWWAWGLGEWVLFFCLLVLRLGLFRFGESTELGHLKLGINDGNTGIQRCRYR